MWAEDYARFDPELKLIARSLANFVGPFASDTAALVCESAEAATALETLSTLEWVAPRLAG